MGDIWHVDELFITLHGQRRYLWRAVDQDGDVIDILVTNRRDRRAANRFFRKALNTRANRHGNSSRTSSEPIRQLIARSFLLWSIEPVSTRTIGLKFPINTPVSKSVKCAGSNPPVKHNVFSRCTVRFRFYSESVGTTSKQLTIDSSATEPSMSGKRRHVCAEKEESTDSVSA